MMSAMTVVLCGLGLLLALLVAAALLIVGHPDRSEDDAERDALLSLGGRLGPLEGGSR